MIKRMIIMLVGVGLVLGAFAYWQQMRAGFIKGFLATMANPVQTVSDTTAATQSWQTGLQAVGNLRAVNGADLSLEVAGVVDRIDFKSGDDVPAGAELLHLRSDDDEAKLHALQASADLAQVTYDRDSKQFKAQAIAQQVVDSDRFNLKNAIAQVEAQKALLAEKTLRAPFAGRLGIRAVDLGQFLNAGTTVVTLQALDPIFVDFYLPQQNLSQIAAGQTVDAVVDTYPGQKFPGKIVAISPLIDTGTRNVQVRASLANPDHKLLPGMYATVTIDVGKPAEFVTLPQTAVTYNPYGSTVFLVKQNGKARTVEQSFVTTGATRGDQVAVLTGVKAGEEVVTSGQIKLRNGTPVKIDNSVQPSDNPSPPPTNH